MTHVLLAVAFLLSAQTNTGPARSTKGARTEAPTVSTVATIELPPHDPRSLAKLRRQAGQGDPKAQYDLATLYLYGGGVGKDNRQFEAWMAKAAANGHFQAQKSLGWLLGFGYGDPKALRLDKIEGLKWMLLAAEQESGMQSCGAMAMMLQRGMSLEQVAEAKQRVAQVKAMPRPVR